MSKFSGFSSVPPALGAFWRQISGFPDLAQTRNFRFFRLFSVFSRTCPKCPLKTCPLGHIFGFPYIIAFFMPVERRNTGKPGKSVSVWPIWRVWGHYFGVCGQYFGICGQIWPYLEVPRGTLASLRRFCPSRRSPTSDSIIRREVRPTNLIPVIDHLHRIWLMDGSQTG